MLTRPIPALGKLATRPNVLIASAPFLLASFLAAWAAVWLAWETAVHGLGFDGDFSDGPFQLFNALRRIAGGQIYGRDFQAFTGIGTNWVHLPVFFLAGADFRASEISRFLTSGLCHGIAAAALARAFAPAFPARGHALLFGLLFFAAGAAVYGRTFQPGASLLGVRTFCPLLLAAALAVPRPAPWIAMALAGSLLSSVDHALAALIALASAIGVSFVRVAARERRLPLLLGAAAGLGLFTVILLVATAGDVAGPLRYALSDIPSDQFWYFGAPPVQFLPLNAWALTEHPTFAQFGLTYLLGAAALVAIWIRRPLLTPAAAFMFVYATLGTVAQLSYISPMNLHGSERMLFALILAALLTSNASRVATVGVTAVALCIALASLKRLQPSPMPEGRAYLSAEWRTHLAAVDRHAGRGPIWSVYASLPEAERGLFHPDTDYLIHALGAERRARYVARFLETRPALVRLDPPRWPFAPWILLHNWPFYREVVRAYEPVYADDLGSLWRPANLARFEPDSIGGSIDRRGCGSLPAAPADTVYSVSVAYDIANPWRHLPVLGATPRLLLDVTDASNPGFETVSLPGTPGYGGRFVFPIFARAGVPVTICPHVSSLLPGVALSLTGIRAARERLSDPVVRYLFGVARGEWRKRA